nr:hypothetical protein [uncultured Allomuricauda sp.]
MKKLQTLCIKIALLLFFGLMINTVLAAQTDSIDKKEKKEKIVSESEDSARNEKGKADSGAKGRVNQESDKKSSEISELTIQIISICFFLVMLLLIILFFRSKAKSDNPYFGFHSIKFIGLILIFPGICILALISDELINGSTLAALFGTIAGYVLSRDREDDNGSSTLKEKHKQEKKKLLDEISKLKDEVNNLKQGNP